MREPPGAKRLSLRNLIGTWQTVAAHSIHAGVKKKQSLSWGDWEMRRWWWKTPALPAWKRVCYSQAAAAFISGSVIHLQFENRKEGLGENLTSSTLLANRCVGWVSGCRFWISNKAAPPSSPRRFRYQKVGPWVWSSLIHYRPSLAWAWQKTKCPSLKPSGGLKPIVFSLSKKQL